MSVELGDAEDALCLDCDGLVPTVVVEKVAEDAVTSKLKSADGTVVFIRKINDWLRPVVP